MPCEKPRKKINLTRYLQSLLVTLPLALIVLTMAGCKTTKEIVPVDPGEDYREAVAALLPDPPVIPEFPQLKWAYSEGRYSIDEADVDKLLDFRDNALPQYRYEVEVYTAQVDAIIKGLSAEAVPP